VKKLPITTIPGGTLFLIPMVAVVAILGKPFQVMLLVPEPLQQNTAWPAIGQ
jgi:hypothetical protein